MKVDDKIVAGLWVSDESGEDGDIVDAIVDIERTDLNELRIGIREIGEEDITHVYIHPDRAVRLAQALIYEASKEWRL